MGGREQFLNAEFSPPLGALTLDFPVGRSDVTSGSRQNVALGKIRA
jgi:hypothetical protein